MSDWNKIINPKTGRKVSINSNLGKNIIKNYIKQIGGASKITDKFNNVGFTDVASSIGCDDFKSCCLPYLKVFIEELGSSARGVENIKMNVPVMKNDIRIHSNLAKETGDLYQMRVPSWIEFASSFENFPLLKTYYKQIKIIQLCVEYYPNESNNIVNHTNITEIQGYPKGLSYQYTDSQSNNLNDFLQYYENLIGEILTHTPEEIRNMLDNYSSSDTQVLLEKKNNIGWKHLVNQLGLYYPYYKTRELYIFRDNKILSSN